MLFILKKLTVFILYGNIKDLTAFPVGFRASNKLGDWVSEWVIEYAIFLHARASSAMEAEIWHKGNDEDDEIAYFTVRWKTRASFVYRTKNTRWHRQRQ